MTASGSVLLRLGGQTVIGFETVSDSSGLIAGAAIYELPARYQSSAIRNRRQLCSEQFVSARTRHGLIAAGKPLTVIGCELDAKPHKRKSSKANCEFASRRNCTQASHHHISYQHNASLVNEADNGYVNHHGYQGCGR